MDGKNNGSIEGINITNHIRCSFNNKDYVIVGQMEDGRFILHVGSDEPPIKYETLLITEENLTGLVAGTLIYFRHYKINVMQRFFKYFNNGTINYVFDPND